MPLGQGASTRNDASTRFSTPNTDTEPTTTGSACRSPGSRCLRPFAAVLHQSVCGPGTVKICCLLLERWAGPFRHNIGYHLHAAVISCCHVYPPYPRVSPTCPFQDLSPSSASRSGATLTKAGLDVGVVRSKQNFCTKGTSEVAILVLNLSKRCILRCPFRDIFTSQPTLVKHVLRAILKICKALPNYTWHCGFFADPRIRLVRIPILVSKKPLIIQNIRDLFRISYKNVWCL